MLRRSVETTATADIPLQRHPDRFRRPIAPGSPWENGYCESFKARFRDELLNGEIFYILKEVGVVIEEWRRHYNTIRPHSALGWKSPAPETIVPIDQRPVMQ